MSKEFVWNIELDGENCNIKVAVHEDEIVTYEADVEKAHIQITNPEVKQGVLQIDTVTVLYGREFAIQLEKNVPYLKPGKQWLMSETTYEERKRKLIHTNKMAAIIEGIICVILCLVVLAKYLITGEMGDWWFLIVIGTFIAAAGWVQYKDVLNKVRELEQAEAEGA